MSHMHTHSQLLETDFFTQIYVTLIHGLNAAKGFMRDGLLQPQTKMIPSTHKVHNITAGAIATCSVLVCCSLY